MDKNPEPPDMYQTNRLRNSSNSSIGKIMWWNAIFHVYLFVDIRSSHADVPGDLRGGWETQMLKFSSFGGASGLVKLDYLCQRCDKPT